MNNNKRGWVEIVEAFIAVLLISGVLLFLVSQGNFEKTDFSTRVYTTQISILREIQTNDIFRNEILSPLDSILPIEWGSPNFPADIKEKISQRTPDYLDCMGQICSGEDECILPYPQKEEVYAQEVIIFSTLEHIGFRKFKIFCVEKGQFQIEKCPDGTFYGQCTETKPSYCEDGTLIDKCGKCGCPSEKECNSETGECYIPPCSDGTAEGECSIVTIGKYCENKILINKCGECECASGKTCKSNGKCV
jgi:hypothetical protein